MIALITPNRAIVFAVGAFVAYWLLALIVPPLVLREIFNSLAFGAAFIITCTWAPAAVSAVRNNVRSGEWQLILAIFVLWFVVMIQRIYVIAFNYFDRPEAWSVSAIAGFFPYSYMISAFLFLAAPGIKGDGVKPRTIWSMIAAAAIGGVIAGFLLGTSLSSF